MTYAQDGAASKVSPVAKCIFQNHYKPTYTYIFDVKMTGVKLICILVFWPEYLPENKRLNIYQKCRIFTFQININLKMSYATGNMPSFY